MCPSTRTAREREAIEFWYAAQKLRIAVDDVLSILELTKVNPANIKLARISHMTQGFRDEGRRFCYKNQ